MASIFRRDFIAAAIAAGAAGLAGAQTPVRYKTKGRIKQCSMAVNFAPNATVDEMCKAAADAGCVGMDLFPVKDWPTIKKYGLALSTAPREIMTIEDGMLRKEQHAALEKNMHGIIEECAANNVRNMITVGGQRKGTSYEEGADIIVAFLNRLKAHAEDKGVTICMEVMNSKYAPPEIGRLDQVCNHFPWAVEVCKRINSPRVKILFDIYHVQIMDGDIAAHIRENIQWIGHFHTGGVPGRHELDDTQELNYRFIAKTIAETNYDGYVSHEYRPAPGRDPVKSLQQAVQTMDV